MAPDLEKILSHAIQSTTSDNLISLERCVDEYQPFTRTKVLEFTLDLLKNKNFSMIEQACISDARALAPSVWSLFQGLESRDAIMKVMKKVLPITDATGITIHDGQDPITVAIKTWFNSPGTNMHFEILGVLFGLVESSMDILFGTRKMFPKEHQTSDHKPITYANTTKRAKASPRSKERNTGAGDGRDGGEMSVMEHLAGKQRRIEDALAKGNLDEARVASLQQSLQDVLGQIEAEKQVVAKAGDACERASGKVATFGSMTWTRALLSISIHLARGNGGASRFVVHNLATIIESCDTAMKRRSFKEFILFFKDYTPVIDALLRAGNRSVDAATDIIAILSEMDGTALDAFLATNARVVHLNYFFKIFTLKLLKDDAVSVTTLQFILKTNPWVLVRHFLSWQKRITVANLDEERLKELKSAIDRHAEHQRREMTFSPETRKYVSKKWARHVTPGEPGALVTGEGTDELIGAIRDQGTKVGISQFIESISRRYKAGPFRFHVIHLDASDKVPILLPAPFKDEPWIEIRDGDVTGLGLSGLDLVKVPSFIYSLGNLVALDLSNNKLKVLPGLGVMARLKHLDVSRNLLTSFSVDKPIPVKMLDLHGNFLKKLDITAFSRTLKVLDLSRNQIEKISDVTGLELATTLGTLNLSWNQLRSLSHLPCTPPLVMLFVNGNRMTKLATSGLHERTRVVDVSDNFLGGLAGIEAFPAVFKIVANMNYLKNLRAITALPRVKHVEARSNQVEGLPEASILNNLSSIDLRYNPLGDVASEQARLVYMFSGRARDDQP